MAGRLAGLGVTRVVMEATSDYWKPVDHQAEFGPQQAQLLSSQCLP